MENKHAGDFNYYGDEMEKKFSKREYEKDWTLEEVEEEVKNVVYYFKKLVNMAEKISNKR